jgi:uncharacterized protein (TIGR00661 family)
MKYLFIVQGEGRGHMTQAISLRNRLIQNGHEVPSVIVGKSMRREIPSFFYEKIKATIHKVNSPNFVTDKKNIKIRITKTIFYNLFFIRRYIQSIRKINKIVKSEKPDVIVNFYDLLGGIFYLFYNPSIPYHCIGHQYLIFHPEFPFPKGQNTDKFLLKLNTRITSFRADKLLALSFRKLSDIPKKKIYVVPPLLRRSVLQLEPSNKGYIHGYMLNQGYADEITKWHETNQETELHFFWDKKDAQEETVVRRNLVFHKINDRKFLDYMKNCEGYASTAGFESICEAMYLGKPILMVPTSGHYEQKCNALDAYNSGAGIISNDFDLTTFKEYIPVHKTNHTEFRNWVNSSDQIFLSHLSQERDTISLEPYLEKLHYFSAHS